MTTCKIHQIYYSPESFAKLDSGFTPLDNSDGPPHIREYWPIRQYFMNNATHDDELLGFFSPLFFDKTGLKAVDVYDHIENNPGNDVYLFNPFFHLAAWHYNIFTQGEMSHPGLIDSLNQTMKMMDINIDTSTLCMSSANSVYCNYFVATVKFWKKWLMVCEFIFAISNCSESDIGHKLISSTTYIKGPLPMRVFIIERIASLLLAIPNTLKVCPKLIFKNMHYTSNKTIPFLEKMLILDSLKSSFISTKNPLYLNTFNFEKKLLSNEFGLFV